MTDWILVSLLLGAGLLVAGWYSGFLPVFAARFRPGLEGTRRRPRIEWVEQIPQPPRAWDGAQAVVRLVDRQGELEALLESLGFSSRLERRISGLLAQLRATTKVEIPEVAAFQQALDRVERQFESASAAEPEALRQQRMGKRRDPLLRSVLDARSDPDAILELLSVDPIDTLLPFIEEIPFHREGEVIWRTPIDLTVVRKTPADAVRFAALLGELQNVVEEASIRRPPQAIDDLIDAIARARRGARRPDVYLPTLIHGLEAEIADWLAEVPGADGERRRRLLLLLEQILEIRARYGLDAPQDVPHLSGDAHADFKRLMQRVAQVYRQEKWMHGPWLSAFLLSGLIASELANLPPASSSEAPRFALGQIHDEVASGLYDGEETIARLYRLEGRGLAVHSLIYAILRTGIEASQAPADRPHVAKAPAAWRARGGSGR